MNYQSYFISKKSVNYNAKPSAKLRIDDEDILEISFKGSDVNHSDFQEIEVGCNGHIVTPNFQKSNINFNNNHNTFILD